jgi:hypothetical protein
MDVGKVLSLAVAGGILTGTLAGAALQPRMNFAPVRPWQDKRGAPATEPAADANVSASYAMADAPVASYAPASPPFAIAPAIVATSRQPARQRAIDPQSALEDDRPSLLPTADTADLPPGDGEDPSELEGESSDIAKGDNGSD